MRKLRELEDKLIRVESALAVVLVLVTLSLAGYNVVYRNILVRLQQHWAHSGPPLEEATATTPAATKAKTAPTAAEGKAPEAAGGDDFGGFGGGLGDEAPADSPAAGDDFGGFGGGIGDEDEPEPEPATPEPAAGDDFGGFGGGIGDEDEQPAEPPAKPSPPVDEEPAKAGGDDFGGFGGGIGDEDEPAEGEGEGEGAEGFGGFGGGLGDGEAKPKADDGDEDEEEDDFGEEDDLGGEDPFANLADIDAAGQDGALDTGPKGGPPPVGSFADRAVKFIDAIKLGWIDLFLRQLVIIISFLGAILATQRGKHINIDALSKALPKRFQRVVPIVLNLVSVGACLMLARAGWDLVQISREYPKEVLPFADEWQLQLMFPVGFGLLALHFSVRLVEAITGASPPAGTGPGGGGASAGEPDSKAVAAAAEHAAADEVSEEQEPVAEHRDASDSDDEVPASEGGAS